MQSLLTALGLTVALANLPAIPAPESPPAAARVYLAQSTLSWSGSWIWTPENRKWVDKDNYASIELLQGRTVQYCLNGSCWTVEYSERDGIYSFSIGAPVRSYYEFWLGDFNTLEGRFWFDVVNRAKAPDAMIRMASQ